MNTALAFRSATTEDLAQLREFEQGVIAAERPFNTNLKADPITYYDLDELIAADAATICIAEIDNKPVACGSARLRKSSAHFIHETHVYLGFLYVDPEHRGKGLNALLIEELLNWGIAKGATEARLDVYLANASAIRAYEKAGFSKLLVDMRKNL